MGTLNDNCLVNMIKHISVISEVRVMSLAGCSAFNNLNCCWWNDSNAFIYRGIKINKCRIVPPNKIFIFPYVFKDGFPYVKKSGIYTILD